MWQEMEDALEKDDGEAAKKSSSSRPPLSEVDDTIESEDSVREEETVFDDGVTAVDAPGF